MLLLNQADQKSRVDNDEMALALTRAAYLEQPGFQTRSALVNRLLQASPYFKEAFSLGGDGVSALAWSADSRKLAVGLRSGSIQFWTKYTGQMKNGMREGRGTLNLPGGGTYRGDWSKNIKSGNGTYFFANGDSYEGQFLNDSMHGDGIYADAEGNSYRGQFANNVREGHGTMVLNNGQTYESEWRGRGVETADSVALRSAALTRAAVPQVRVTLDHTYMQNSGEAKRSGKRLAVSVPDGQRRDAD